MQARENQEDPVKRALHAFVGEAITHLNRRSEHISHHQRRTPDHDLDYDQQFTRLDSFQPAVSQLAATDAVQIRYGGDEAAKRLVLRFLFAYFDASPDVVFDESHFELAWSLLRRELETPDWRHFGITILQNFHSGIGKIDISDDVSIRIRTLQYMEGTIGRPELDLLIEDCQHGALGQHALLAEHREEKTPQNVDRGNSYHPDVKLRRGLLALRLLKSGEPRPGRFIYCRPALVPKRLAGVHTSGVSFWQPGDQYVLDPSDVPLLQTIYSLLVRFDGSHASTTWKSLSLALRRFTAVYDVDGKQPDDQVLDAVIAMEALLGIDQEIAHRLSSRVASLLALEDENRVEIYRAMKRFYETRNKIAHGGDLNARNIRAIDDRPRLMEFLRRLLVAFLRLATSSSELKNQTKFKDELDYVLLHAKNREALQREMGLLIAPT